MTESLINVLKQNIIQLSKVANEKGIIIVNKKRFFLFILIINCFKRTLLKLISY